MKNSRSRISNSAPVSRRYDCDVLSSMRGRIIISSVLSDVPSFDRFLTHVFRHTNSVPENVSAQLLRQIWGDFVTAASQPNLYPNLQLCSTRRPAGLQMSPCRMTFAAKADRRVNRLIAIPQAAGDNARTVPVAPVTVHAGRPVRAAVLFQVSIVAAQFSED